MVKEGIQGIVDDRYADLERMLQQNMGGVKPVPDNYETDMAAV